MDKGKIFYADHTPVGISAEIHNIELELLSVPLKRMFEIGSTFDVNVVFRSAKFIASSVLYGELDVGKNKFQLTELDIKTKNGGLKLTGEIYDLKKTPSVDLILTIDKTILSKIVKQLSSSMWFQLKFLQNKQLKLKMKGSLDKINFIPLFQEAA